jgi:hypothetical protein
MLVALQLVGVTGIPLNVMVLNPWLAPKFVPVIVTCVPTAPEFGLRLVMVGEEAVETVNVTPLLAVPPTVTTTFPVIAPVGTGATMLLALQLVGVARVPLNEIVLVPCVAPKFAPLMVTEVPIGPKFGVRFEMVGAEVVGTVNATPLLAVPPTVTTTFPVVAPVGTGATMLVAPQLVGVAVIPLNCTVLDPWLAPKFVPVIVTDVPTGPDVGFRTAMVGEEVVVTVNATALLAVPPTVTTTFPFVAPVGTGATMLVALQLVGIAAIPLNVIVLDPWLAPKFVPVIVTDVPTGPEVGFRFVMVGEEVVVTVNATALLAVPPTVTTTFPVVAPAGTGATMLVAFQLVGVAAIPLNLIVLEPWLAPKPAPMIVTMVPTGPEDALRPEMLGVC